MKVSSPSRFEHCENDGLKNTIWFADRDDNIPSSVRL